MFLWVFFPQMVKQTLQHELLQDVHEQTEGYGHAAYGSSVRDIEFSDHEVRNTGFWNHADQDVVGEDQDQDDHKPRIGDEVLFPWCRNAECNDTEHVHEVREHEDRLDFQCVKQEICLDLILCQVDSLTSIGIIAYDAVEGWIGHQQYH